MAMRIQKIPTWFRALASLLVSKKINKKKSLPKQKAGVHHNLNELFDELNGKYFSGSLSLTIAWSGSGTTLSKSVVRLGYYNPQKRLIKINRILDYPHIPRYFVSFIVYHEILHHILPPYQAFGSKRKIHHAEFKKKEREFQEYQQSHSFLKDFKKELFAPKKLRKDFLCKTP